MVKSIIASLAENRAEYALLMAFFAAGCASDQTPETLAVDALDVLAEYRELPEFTPSAIEAIDNALAFIETVNGHQDGDSFYQDLAAIRGAR